MIEQQPKLTVVIPAYNENENLINLIKVIIEDSRTNEWNFIIVNDGSADNTKELLNNVPKNFQIINHKVNRGYGGALKSGIRASSTEYTITMDADGQHTLIDAEKLLKTIINNDADMVIGKRNRKNQSLYRMIGKWFIRKLTHFLISDKIHDINSGMKISRTELLQRYIEICPDGMAFSDFIGLIFLQRRHLVIEADIQINKRTSGNSTIGIKTAFQTIYEIINIVMLFNPIKIFIPLSIFFAILGFVWGIPIILAGKGVSTGSAFLLITSVNLFLWGLIAEQISLIRKKQVQE